jgi:hypothetical protein
MLRTLALLALFAAPVRADDKPKPNALTAKEIAEGWINLFDGETTFGWKVEGEATVKDGTLILPKGKKAVAYPTARFGSLDMVSVEVSGTATVHLPNGVGTPRAADTPEWAKYTFNPLRGGGPPPVAGKRPEVAAGAALCIESNGDTEVRVRAAKLRVMGAQPLFNGKDLTGWKVNGADPKRTASKWSVTKEGELAVKDGPGDLVCEKEFANFVLQFECKTNGKALNSGIFFRCIPGQYQNGYEAQIQNAYKDDDRTKPADFGTGAIYRRVAARKVVSNDNEWFTMTVAANGKHIATWVNGYQTVDWTDDRKENDNPRQGYRAAKGPLSIQGHDPTTDILFRNIRVSELPAK